MKEKATIILGDLHLGAKKNEIFFMKYQKKFFDFLFSYIDDSPYKITDIIQLGDLLDNRQSLNFLVNNFLQDYLLPRIESRKEKWHLILGNHDLYLRNSLSISGTEQLLRSRKNLEVIDTPKTLSLNGTDFVCIPWVCKENLEQVTSYIEENKSPARVLCGHFELANFRMNQYSISKTGSLPTELLDGYKEVFSGHYHTPSTNSYIHYVGTPYEITWNDYGDEKRFVLYKEQSWENVPTNFPLFFKIRVEDIDLKETKKEGLGRPELQNSYIKLSVEDKAITDKDLSYLTNLIEETYSPRFLAVEDYRHRDREEVELLPEDVDDPFSALTKTIEHNYEDKSYLPDMLEYASKFYSRALDE